MGRDHPAIHVALWAFAHAMTWTELDHLYFSSSTAVDGLSLHPTILTVRLIASTSRIFDPYSCEGSKCVSNSY